MAGRALPPGAGDRIERESSLHDSVEENAEGPCVRGAAVVFLPDQDFGRGVVFAAAAGVEEGGFRGPGDPAAETEVREGDDGGRVGLPVGGWSAEGGGGDVDEDVYGVRVR